MCWCSTSLLQITPNLPQLPALSRGRAQQGSKGRSRTHGAVTHNTDWMLMLKGNEHAIVGGGEGGNTRNQSSHTFAEDSDYFGFPLPHNLWTFFFLGCIFHFFFFLFAFSTILGSTKPMLLKDNVFLQLSPVVSKLTQGTWIAILEQAIFNKSH